MTHNPDIRDAARLTYDARPVQTSHSADAAEATNAPEVPADTEAVVETGAVQKSTEPAKKRGGFFPLFLGGLVAAAMGFAAAYVLMQPSSGDSELPQRVSGLEQTLAGIESRLNDLQGSVDDLASSIPEPPW